LNRKVIRALSRIGTPEAISGIRLALDSDDAIIKEAAREELERNGWQ
jgi:HEAT repeat protein